MSQLIELVFDGVSMAVAERLLDDLLARTSGACSAEIDGVPLAGPAHGRALVGAIKEFAWVRLGTFVLPGLGPVANVALRVLHLGAVWDVELNLDLDDVAAPELLTDALHELAQTLAERHDVACYYAGLEPAIDEDTRLFTGPVRGPIHLSAR
ncbi:MAG: hypothetical protein IT370_24390 [Deltaproteobacteria bacterium]|nr:hypothetical protein [Deltaproteobacteria bacterium]